jgi:spermidine/putrescine transport system ATP-binding protein
MLARSASPPESHNVLPGVVRHASYIGVSTQYIVETGHGSSVVVYEQNVERATKAELREPGEEVTLAWSPDHSFVVDPASEGETDTASTGGSEP